MIGGERREPFLIPGDQIGVTQRAASDDLIPARWPVLNRRPAEKPAASRSAAMPLVRLAMPLAAALIAPSLGCRTTGAVRTTDRETAPSALIAVSEGDTLRGDSDDRQAPSSRDKKESKGKESSRSSEIQQVEGTETSDSDIGQTAVAEQGAAAETVPVEPLAEAAVPAAHSGISVFDAISTALAQNPDLLAQRETEWVGRGNLGLAQTYPFNPYVQVQATPYQHHRDGRDGTTNHYVLVIQQIQLAHQQAHRENVAGAQLNSVRWNILQAQLNTIAQTERLYFTALYQAGLRDLAKTTADNNKELLSILEKRLELGDATGADVAIVRLDMRSTRQQLLLAEANLATALLDLRRHIGLLPTAPVELASRLEEYPWRPLYGANWGGEDATGRPVESIGVASLDGPGMAAGRPDVLAARSDVDAARAGADLANASRVPDLQIGPYYQRNDAGTEFWGFRGQMDILVWNTGTPLLRLREAELRQRVMTWRQLERRAGLEAEAAIDRYNRAFRLLISFEEGPDRGEKLPLELQKLEEQFVAGEVDILRVFQSRNSLIQNRRALLDSLNEIAQSAANVTASTGLPLECLLADPSAK